MSFVRLLSLRSYPMGIFPAQCVHYFRKSSQVNYKLCLSQQSTVALSQSERTKRLLQPRAVIATPVKIKNSISKFSRVYESNKMNTISVLLAGVLGLASITKEDTPPLQSNEQIHLCFYHALNLANQELEKDAISVNLKKQIPEEPKSALIDPTRNQLLEIQQEGQREPIDIVSLQCTNTGAIKTAEELGKEIVHKVNQHLIAKKIAGICFSASGSKLDVRALKENRVAIDSEGYLTANGRRVLAMIKEKPEELQAERLRSYTILRFIENDGVIRIFDEFDLVRPDSKGMYIDLSGPAPCIKRDQLSDKIKQDLKKACATPSTSPTRRT